MGLRAIIGDLRLNRWKRHVESATLAFPEAIASTRKILVCLPEGLRELTLVKQFLPTIKDTFHPADVTLLSLPGVNVNDIYPRKGFHILSPAQNQVTWSGLPKKAYLDKLAEHGFDMVLDLNLQHSRFTRGVLLGLPRAVRVGRGNHLGEPYYNLEIKSKYLRDERNIYRSLLTILGKIRQSAKDSLAAGSQN